MKYLLVVAVAAGAFFYVATTDDQADARNPGDTAWESRVEQVDTYLSEGLSGDTHRTIAEPAHDGAELVSDLGNSLSGFTE